MKAPMNTLLAAATAIACFLLPACSKVYDHVKDNPDEIGKFCRIQTLAVTYPGGPQHAKIIYNSAGNPVDMLAQDSSWQNYDFHFRYDKWNRLTDYYNNTHGSLGVFVWHRYSYPAPRIVIDSTFDYVGLITDPIPPDSSSAEYLTKYELDQKGRIIRQLNIDMTTGQPAAITDYSYDNKGNQVIPGVVYDNKINIYQTNIVWQFIFKEYSRNNPLTPSSLYYSLVTISSYNDWGLPLEFQATTAPGGPPFPFYYYYTVMDIGYSCETEQNHSNL